MTSERELLTQGGRLTADVALPGRHRESAHGVVTLRVIVKEGGDLLKLTSSLVTRVKWWFFGLRLKIEDRRNRAYDHKHNVETAGEMSLEAAGVAIADVRRGNTLYRVTWERLIRRAVEKLGIDYSDYTFIDYGAGKGKAMFVAADYPFKRIIGVEYAPHLATAAQRNCQTFQSATQQCFSLEAICGDVLNYALPAGPVVCFMCNPFDAATLQGVFDIWRERCAGGERDIRILYLNLRNVREVEGLLAAQTWLRVDARDTHFVLLAPRADEVTQREEGDFRPPSSAFGRPALRRPLPARAATPPAEPASCRD